MTHPHVSVVVPTANRPHFLRIVLRCFAEQTYPERELIIVDDSATPVDESQVSAAGGILLRMEPGSTAGDKLNAGIMRSTGGLIQRMDDDDYYAPEFMQRMVDAYRAANSFVCRPCVLGMNDTLFFNVRTWDLRRSSRPMAGRTLFFARHDWEDCPFRPVNKLEDVWFRRDLLGSLGNSISVPAEISVVAIRHGSNIWQGTAKRNVDKRMLRWPRHDAPPEAVLPEWAIAVYRSLQDSPQ